MKSIQRAITPRIYVCLSKTHLVDFHTHLSHKALSKCVTLINAIHDLGNRGFNNSVSQKAKDGEITRSEPWCDLRHYLGRWHSYRQAADGIVAAAKRWPFLFQDFEITMVPSSSRIPKPIQKTRLPASEIIEHMAERDNLDADPIQQMVRDLQIPELDEIIREHLNARRFRPIVHAEVLVHAHLRRLDPLSPDKFWNNWNYIGSSKPTCRLCHYYFDSFEGCKVYVRQSHHNLYKKWRLPDFDEAFDTEEKRDQLLERIAQKLRDDVRSSLKEKNIKGKVHDSNTYSSVPDMLQGNWRGVATDERGWQQHARAAAEDNGSTALTERNVSSLNLTDGNGESSD